MAKISKPLKAPAKKAAASRTRPAKTVRAVAVYQPKKPVTKVSAKPVPKKTPPQPAAPVLQVKEEVLEDKTAEDLAPPALSSLPKTVPLTLSVQTSQGHAAAGNMQPANLLVVVTSGGWPVTELDQNHFTLMQHFDVPGQTAPFSNNITTFRNAGSGAYLLQTRPINGAPWRSGHHLGQLLVSSSSDQQGQAAFKLIIR